MRADYRYSPLARVFLWHHENKMVRFVSLRKSIRWMLLTVSVVAVPMAVSSARAEEEAFEGPKFRKGEWHFVRTLEAAKGKIRLLEREMTRCVDPTLAMKAVFSSASVGNCHSEKPQRVANKYIFAKRCDYMGPVSTVITVQSEDAYTEVNELTVGKLPRTDLVVAHRIGNCQDESEKLARRSDLSIPH
jgi:hypothetical protein